MKGIGLPIPAPADWKQDTAWLSQGGFLFDPVRGLTFSLNNSAAFVYGLLAEGAGVNDIVEALVQRFHLDVRTARADVEDFLSEMRSAGLR